jgi:protein TonB
MGEVKPGLKEETGSDDPERAPSEDPNDPAAQGERESGGVNTPPAKDSTQPPVEQPAEQPQAKPAQKPQSRVTPPPAAPVLPEGMEQSEEAAAPPEGQPGTKAEGQPGAKAEGDPVGQPAVKPEPKAAEGTPPAKSTTPPEEATDPPAESQEQAAPPPPVKPQRASLGDIVAIQQVDRQPEIISQELPRYPTAARGRGITGTVLINALISENGDVLQTVVLRKIESPYNFHAEAERAVKLWKFRPAWKDGVRVKTWKVIPIAFKENMD